MIAPYELTVLAPILGPAGGGLGPGSLRGFQTRAGLGPALDMKQPRWVRAPSGADRFDTGRPVQGSDFSSCSGPIEVCQRLCGRAGCRDFRISVFPDRTIQSDPGMLAKN